MFLLKVCAALEKESVAYAVVGGHAVALHGAIRGTVDIDIIIKWSLANLEKVEAVFRSLQLVPRLPISAKEVYEFQDELIRKRNLFAWTFHNPANPLEQLDLMINYDLGHRPIKRIESSQGNVNIINIDCLIEMKRESGRPQDLEDIKALEQLK